MNRQQSFRNLFFYSIVAGLLLYAGCSQALSQQKKSQITVSIINDDKTPSKDLAKLLEITHTAHDNTLAGIVKATQQAWLRPAGKERWEMEDIFSAQKEQILPLIKRLGMIDEIKPTDKYYNYAIVLGAITRTMRTRFAYLIEQWQQGVRFDQIIFLVGARPLDATLESHQVVLNTDNTEQYVRKNWSFEGILPSTETDAAKIVYHQADLPVDMGQIPVRFIDTPMQPTNTGSVRRPNTADTIAAWLATNPKPGSCLFISNQPYCSYQNSIVKTVLPASFSMQTVGSKASDDTSITMHLDNIARFLFSEEKRHGA